MKTPVTLLLALLLGTAVAETRVPGTYTYYSVSKDPISDVNTSYVAIDEFYDRDTESFIVFQCANDGRSDLWAKLVSKNMLVDPDRVDQGIMPAVVMRLGSDTPITVGAASLNTVLNSKEVVLPERLAFSQTMTRAMVAGLQAGKKLVVRVTPDGRSALTFTFPAKGFDLAWKSVNSCK